jgi:hypothetical protein
MISKELQDSLSKLLEKKTQITPKIKNEIRKVIKKLESQTEIKDSIKAELCIGILKKSQQELDRSDIS